MMNLTTRPRSPAGPCAVFVCAVMLAACGGAGKTSRAPSAAEPSMVAGTSDMVAESDPRAEIDRLWNQIEMWRDPEQVAGDESPESVPAAAGADQSSQPDVRSGTQRGAARARTLCPDESEQAAPLCNDVCVLAGSICENAENICRIAAELAGDAWAEGKCDSARTTCEQATERCCACRHGERPDND